MTKALFILLTITSILAVYSCNPKSNLSKNEVGIKFEKSKYLDDVLTLAKEEDKLVFIDFHAEWCVPCKLMEKDVFTDKSIAEFYNTNFINYKVDGESEKGKNLAFILQIGIYPTLLFLDSDGNIVHRNDGALYHTDFRSFGNEALDLKAL